MSSRGSGQEVVSIHLGSYANYVGAHLWNLDYHRMTVGSAGDDSSGTSGDDRFPTGSHILFRASQNRGASVLTPRALFCDFYGSIPALPAPVRPTKASSKSSSDRDYDALHLSAASQVWEGKWDQPSYDAYSAGGELSSSIWSAGPSRMTLSQTQQQEIAAKEQSLAYQSSWRGLLQPFVHPKSICLTSQHALESQCDLFCHGSALASSTGCGSGFSSGSSIGGGMLGDDYSYLENLSEAIRWHAEDCDRLEAMRLFVDSDSAWAGLGQQVLHLLADEYRSAASLVFATSPPVSVFGPSPTSLHPHVWSAYPSTPFAAAYTASTTPSTVVYSHQRRALSLAQLSAAAVETCSMFVPLAHPHHSQVLRAFADLAADPRLTFATLPFAQLYATASTSSSSSSSSLSTSAGGAASSLAALSSLIPPSVCFAYASSAVIAHGLHTLFAPTLVPSPSSSNSTSQSSPSPSSSLSSSSSSSSSRGGSGFSSLDTFSRTSSASSATGVSLHNLLASVVARPKLNTLTLATAAPANSRLPLFSGALAALEGQSHRNDARTSTSSSASSSSASAPQVQGRSLHMRAHPAGLYVLSPLIAPQEGAGSRGASSSSSSSVSRSIEGGTMSVSSAYADTRATSVLLTQSEEAKASRSDPSAVPQQLLSKLTSWAVASNLSALANDAVGFCSQSPTISDDEASSSSSFSSSSSSSSSASLAKARKAQGWGGRLSSGEVYDALRSAFLVSMSTGPARSKYMRHSTAIVDPLVVSTSAHEPIPSSFFQQLFHPVSSSSSVIPDALAARLAASLHVSASGSLIAGGLHTPLHAPGPFAQEGARYVATVVDLFATNQTSQGYEALRARSAEAQKNALINKEYHQAGFGPEEWSDLLQQLAVLHDEYEEE